MVRADARENRARILDVARRAFADDPTVSMNQIAKLAEVGAGTLYRNYPTREALALAVYEADVVRLVDAVPGLLAAHPPLVALRRWTTELVTAMRSKHGLGDALSPSARDAASERHYGPVIGAITAVFDAGRADGSIRADADPRDFLQLTGALWRAGEDRTGPMLDLVLDGLAARRP